MLPKHSDRPLLDLFDDDMMVKAFPYLFPWGVGDIFKDQKANYKRHKKPTEKSWL